MDDALAFTGLDQVEVNHKPRLLSDNGPCYVSGELSDYLEQQGMTHTRGAPYHESLDNLTPADVFYGRDQDILEQRQQIKHNTMSMRRKMVYDNRNNLTNLMS